VSCVHATWQRKEGSETIRYRSEQHPNVSVRPASCSGVRAMSPKETGTGQEVPPPPPLSVSAASQDEISSTIVAPTLTSSSDEPQSTTLPILALPSHPDATRSASPTSSPDLQPSVALMPIRAPDRYQILAEHGRGGIGRVSRAYDCELGRDVAIKELISRGSLAEARFLREATITARLEHPGIVPVHEAGRWPDGTPFYAMKLVSGRPLRELILERTTVDQRLGLLHHVIAVADAIAYAHGRNIIHRDLKPANVIVGEFGETIVIDWGLAKALSTSDEPTVGDGPFHIHPGHDHELTTAGAILGTPSYMAPEQERGEQVDQRADVFAIGAMLWEICSLHKVPPANLRQRHRLLRRDGIDQDLIVILDKALDPDPSRRYPDAGVIAADLKAFKSGARITARRYSLPATFAHWTRRHRALAWSVGSALVIVAAFGVLYIRSIATERDRTNGALQRVEAAKDDLVLERATLLLNSDPTAALAALDGYHGADISQRTESLSQAYGPGVTRGVGPTATDGRSHNDPPNASRQQRAAQIVADALGRGTATYALSPDIGTIAYVEWSSLNKLLIRGTDDKLVEWQLGHKTSDQEISLAAFSYSSTDDRRRLLAYQRSDAGVRLRDLQTDNETDLGRLNGTPWALMVSPTGQYVAAAVSTGEIVLWDGSARRLRSHSRPPGIYQALRFSPDSSMLAACGRDGRLAVWSVATGDLVTEGQCDGLANVDYEFAGDGKSLIIGYRSGMIDQLRLPDKRTAVGQKLSIAHGAITEIVAGPNMSVLIGTDTGELLLYDATSTQVVWRTQLASGVARATYDKHYNLIFAGCSDGRISMMTGTGRSVGVLQGHTSRVLAISLSEDSHWLASGSADGTVRIWALPVPAVISVHLASASLFSAAFSPDGELVAAEAQDGTVSICAMKTLECTTTVAHESLASGLAWRHDGTALASTGWDGRLRVWNRTSGKSEGFRLSTENGAVYLGGYLKNDQSALLLFRGKSWEIRRIEDHQSISSLVFDSKASVSLSADGSRLAVTTAAGSLSVWDTSHSEPQMLTTTMLNHVERSAPEVTLSRSGRFAVVQFASGVLYVVTISTRGRAALRTIPNLGAGVPWLASFSPDEANVAVSYSDGRIVTIRTATGEETSYHPLAKAAAGLWMGNLRLVGLTREGYVWIYDHASGAQCVTHIERESILGASLSPNENTIAIAGESGHLHFYNIESCRWANSL
jgi:eukaryotic-like serine/threonine-protein kinase